MWKASPKSRGNRPDSRDPPPCAKALARFVLLLFFGHEIVLKSIGGDKPKPTQPARKHSEDQRDPGNEKFRFCVTIQSNGKPAQGLPENRNPIRIFGQDEKVKPDDGLLGSHPVHPVNPVSKTPASAAISGPTAPAPNPRPSSPTQRKSRPASRPSPTTRGHRQDVRAAHRSTRD